MKSQSGEGDLDLIPHGIAAATWPAPKARVGILLLLK
jgi:hypothetical protein